MGTEVKLKNKGTRDEELKVISNRVTVACFRAYEHIELFIETFDDEVYFDTDTMADIYEIVDCLSIVIGEYERKLADDEKIKQLKARIKELEAEIEKIENGVD